MLQSTKVMAGNHQLNLLKQYFQSHSPYRFYSSSGRATFINAIQVGSLEIVIYLVEELRMLSEGIYKWLGDNDYMYFASRYGRFDIIQYLELSPVQWNFAKAFAISPRSGNMDIVKYFGQKHWKNEPGITENSRYNPFDNAAFMGRIDMIEWLIENKSDYLSSSSMLHYAIQSDHLQVIQYLIQHNIIYFQTIFFDFQLGFYCSKILNYAAKYNRFEILRYLHNNGVGECSSGAIDCAVDSKNLEMIQWFHTNRPEVRFKDALDKAAKKGYLDIAQWINRNRTEGCKLQKTMDSVAEIENLEMIGWIHQNRTEGCSHKAMVKAATKGNLQMVRWIHSNRSEGCTYEALNNAAANGHFEVVRFLSENRSEGCTVAAMDYSKTLDITKYLHENRTEGCSAAALTNAASNGSLDILKFLHENRTESFDKSAFDMAVKNNHLDVVKFLYENRTEGCSDFVMDLARNLDMIEYLHYNQIGKCSDVVMNNAILDNNLDLVKFLSENRTETFKFSTIIQAVRKEQIEMVIYILQNNPQCLNSNSKVTMLTASAENNHYEMFKWLFKHLDYTIEEIAKVNEDLFRNSELIIDPIILEYLKIEILIK
ncbi:hypothetical protein PPL_01162 [Heterostelium album PN500]|uniref:Ankyrin repeat protein n=1 Tax=Heterostelium pallidum (strain ATCC 26659 / Pp 5 / PN500) TaxID=670386 RepID=D3AYA2_HETP5|nr:hypothetical protein PPL_01162 [Heterostelium album PN500]EFA85929.1 hypothetical protein PPL_01162 [Heterostelium album PN500]|eukprot:XP_020438035.1 hypothetical protein PPL_01162 [Heterostelium album PN500]